MHASFSSVPSLMLTYINTHEQNCAHWLLRFLSMIQWWHEGNYRSGEQEQFVSPLQTVSHQALQEPLGQVGPKLG